jgi:hypothetical protein
MILVLFNFLRCNINAPTDTVQSAYLYWAGSGTGDFSVNLNSQIIVQNVLFYNSVFWKTFFSAFANVTSQV